MLRFKGYDAVSDFKRSHTLLLAELKQSEGKPRVQQAVRERLALVRTLFVSRPSITCTRRSIWCGRS